MQTYETIILNAVQRAHPKLNAVCIAPHQHNDSYNIKSKAGDTIAVYFIVYGDRADTHIANLLNGESILSLTIHKPGT